MAMAAEASFTLCLQLCCAQLLCGLFSKVPRQLRRGGRVRYAGYRNSIRQTPIKRCRRDRLRPLAIDLLSQIIAYLQRGRERERGRGGRGGNCNLHSARKMTTYAPFQLKWACQADKPSAASRKLRQAIYTANAYRQIKWKPTCLAKLPASCN